MKTKLFVCGRSSSGKDRLTTYICEELGLKQLLSYATRPLRFPSEDTHIFITEEESKWLQENEDILAYTKIGNYEYFGTYQQLLESDVYIIDYEGVKFFNNNYKQKLLDLGIQMITIYVHTDPLLRAERAMLRCNDLKVYNDRCIAEHEQFNEMESLVDFDWFVNNNNGIQAMRIIKEIVKMYI